MEWDHPKTRINVFSSGLCCCPLSVRLSPLRFSDAYNFQNGWNLRTWTLTPCIHLLNQLCATSTGASAWRWWNWKSISLRVQDCLIRAKKIFVYLSLPNQQKLSRKKITTTQFRLHVMCEQVHVGRFDLLRRLILKWIQLIYVDCVIESNWQFPMRCATFGTSVTASGSVLFSWLTRPLWHVSSWLTACIMHNALNK